MSSVILFKTVGKDKDGVVRACAWAGNEADAQYDRRALADDLALATIDTVREAVPTTPEALATWLCERNVGNKPADEQR